MNFEAIVEKARSGDQQASTALVMKIRDELWIVCCHFFTRREDAEDALNDGYYLILKALPKMDYCGEREFFSWSKTIVSYRCMLLRSKRKTVELGPAESQKQSIPPEALENLYAGEITKVLGQIPERNRQVFMRFVMNGKRHLEIAEELGITVNTTTSLIKRTKQMLRDKLIAKNIYYE